MKTLLLLGLVAALTPATPAPGHSVLVLNHGNEAIYELYAGHAEAGEWGPDLLGFAQVIDVSSGRDVAVDVDPASCVYDVKAVYGDGHVSVLQDVDLCTAGRIEFEH